MKNAGILARARPDILAMKAYSSARSLTAMTDDNVRLDANELPFAPLIGTEGYNHYPPQQPPELIAALAGFYDIAAQNILVTRGEDEAIDVLTRLFCVPGGDSIIVCPPTFPMYEMAANWNGTETVKIPLNDRFEPAVEHILTAVRDDTKLVYLCSPNNPTGNSVALSTIEKLCKALINKALVVVDEAYAEFSTQPSALSLLPRFDNLAVLRTLSKAMALAGVRCGALLAQKDIILQSLKILAPYPLPLPTIHTALKTLELKNRERLETKRTEILAVKEWFIEELATVPDVESVFPSDTNFVLAKCRDANKMYHQCLNNGFVVRNQSHQPGLTNCLRFSISTRDQMEGLLHVLKTGQRPATQPGRRAHVVRKTKETAIEVIVDLDANMPVKIRTGIGFFDHMLEQIARHGGFALTLDAIGDLYVDEHHTIEDCGIVLGQALQQALGNKAGIERYGFTLPMDEALASVALDLSGRAFFKFEGIFPDGITGAMPSTMVEHFFRSLSENLHITLHMKVEGENTHHMIEACFKAFGRALRQAIRQTDGTALPSTKGAL